jgi:hypothetical protein
MMSPPPNARSFYATRLGREDYRVGWDAGHGVATASFSEPVDPVAAADFASLHGVRVWCGHCRVYFDAHPIAEPRRLGCPVCDNPRKGETS